MLFSFRSPRMVRYFPISATQRIPSNMHPWQPSSVLRGGLLPPVHHAWTWWPSLPEEIYLKRVWNQLQVAVGEGLTQITEYGGQKECFHFIVCMGETDLCRGTSISGDSDVADNCNARAMEMRERWCYRWWKTVPVFSTNYFSVRLYIWNNEKNHHLNAFPSVPASGKDCDLLLFSWQCSEACIQLEQY